MSVIEPPPPGDDDDPFVGLEGIFDDVEQGVVNVTLLSDDALLTEFNAVTEEIKERREVLSPATDRGRELHSLRAALNIELRQRGILG